MALFYQSGRVSRFAVGVPGFSTNRDLVLDVDGAIGVDTSEPRASIDTPEISIRGPIYDAGIQTGGLGYFLSQDVEGVKWVAASPFDLTFVRVYEDDVQVGVSSFSGLNFTSQDPFLIDVKESLIGPNIADINVNTYWIKKQYGDNFGISTAFGPDGTFWSLPGYGTSDGTVGFTSVGIGTDNPQDDFQVGIGSTGVQINGELGRVDAQIIKAKNLELDGNLTAESLVIDPGISTFRGNIDAQGISSFKGDVTAGVATIQDLNAISFDGENVITGYTTLGVGLGLSEFIYVESNIEVQGGIGTFLNDLFVGNDLYVAGETFFNQINAVNIIVSGIATINEYEALSGITTFAASGLSTIGQVGFNTGIGTALSLEQGDVGILTAVDVTAGVATIGFASLTDAFVGGAVTVTRVDVEEIEIDDATVGILTVGFGKDETDGTFYRTGVGTIVGFTTVTGDYFIDGDLTVTQQFTVKDLGAENLEVTGIGTIVNLLADVGIVTTLFTEAQVNSGISTFEIVDADEVLGIAGTIGGVGFDSGRIEADEIDADFGRIGILTGNTLDYNLGIITYVSAGVGSISSIRGDNIVISSPTNTSSINNVTVDPFGNIQTPGNLVVNDFLGIGITLGDTSDPKTGLTTIAGDAYVGNDLYVGGEQFIEQLNTTNLSVSGIATVNELDLNIGVGTFFDLDYLQVGLATITNLLGTISTITRMDSGTVAVTTDPSKYPTSDGQFYADRAFIQSLTSEDGRVNNLDVSFTLNAEGTLDVTGLATFRSNVDFEQDIDVTGLTTTTYLYAGIGTIEQLDVDFIDADASNTGVGTIGDLVVTNSADFQGDVVVDIGGTANINNANIGFASITQQVVGTSTVGFLSATDANIGVATVGLVSATDIEVEDLEVNTARIGVSTTGYAVIGTGATTDGALKVTGVSTFIGFTTYSGDVFVDGDFTVTGLQSVGQLDAKQSQIGILTVFEISDLNGQTDIENVAISSSFISNAGVSTLGFTTITDSLHIRENLTVGGITTFEGVVNIDKVEFVELSVTGVATVGELNFGVGIGTTLSAQVATASSLTVTGPSTFVGVGTFQDDLYVSEDLYVDRNVLVGSALTVPELTVTSLVNVSGAATITNASIGVATIGFASITNEIVGTSTVGFLSVTDASLSGIVTFSGELDIDADVDIDGLLRVNDLIVTGVTTLNVADVSSAEIDVAEITDATISTSRIGFSSVGILTVGYGNSTDGTFYRSGVGTIVGFTTITGDLFVDGDFTVTGVQSVGQLDAAQSRIGILTIGQYLDADYIVQGPLGFASFTQYSADVGFVTTLNAETANVDELNVNAGFATALTAEALVVTGITTLGNIDPVTGFTTTLGDLYVGGDLFVQDDIFYDEITGRNLSISGIATINDLRANVGVITDISGLGSVTYPTGYFDVIDVNITDTESLISIAATVQGRLFVIGESEFVGASTFRDNVDIRENLLVQGSSEFVGTIDGSNILLSNSIAAIGASFRSGFIDNVFSGIVTTVDANITGVGSFGLLTGFGVTAVQVDTQSILSDNISNSGLTTTNDLTVYNNTLLENLTVNGTSNFIGTVFIDQDVTVNGDLNVIGLATATDLVVQNNLDVGNITTTRSLTVDGGDFYANTGVSSFQNGLDVYGNLSSKGLFDAVSGIVSTISGDDLTYDNVNVTDQLTVTGETFLGGIATASNLDVTGRAVIGVASISDLDATVGYVNDLTFNTGIGTSLDLDNATVDTIGIGTANVGVATVTDLTAENIYVKDVVTITATRTQTLDTNPTTIFSLDTSAFTTPPTTYEFLVQAMEGTRFHSTKILAVCDLNNAFMTEYGSVFSVRELGSYTVAYTGTTFELITTAASASPTTFSVTVTAIDNTL